MLQNPIRRMERRKERPLGIAQLCRDFRQIRTASTTFLAVSATRNSAMTSSIDFFACERISPSGGIGGSLELPGFIETYSDPIKVGLSTIAIESALIREA